MLVNPATYAVDGIRGALIGIHRFSLLSDFLVVTVFAAVMIAIGTYAFKKMRL